MEKETGNCYFNYVHDESLQTNVFKRQQDPFFRWHLTLREGLLRWGVGTVCAALPAPDSPLWPVAPLSLPGSNSSTDAGWLRQDPKGPALPGTPYLPGISAMEDPFPYGNVTKEYVLTPEAATVLWKDHCTRVRSPAAKAVLCLLPQTTYWHMHVGFRVDKTDHTTPCTALWWERLNSKINALSKLWYVTCVYSGVLLDALPHSHCITLTSFPRGIQSPLVGAWARNSLACSLPGTSGIQSSGFVSSSCKRKQRVNNVATALESSPTCFRTQLRLLSRALEIPRVTLSRTRKTNETWQKKRKSMCQENCTTNTN